MQFLHCGANLRRIRNRVYYFRGIKLRDWTQIESVYPRSQDSIGRFAEPNLNDPANFSHDPTFSCLAKDASHLRTTSASVAPVKGGRRPRVGMEEEIPNHQEGS